MLYLRLAKLTDKDQFRQVYYVNIFAQGCNQKLQKIDCTNLINTKRIQILLLLVIRSWGVYLTFYIFCIIQGNLRMSSLASSLLLQKSPLKQGDPKYELENVPPTLGNRVRKHIKQSTQPQANLSSPNGVISSLAGISSPPLRQVAKSPHARQRTLPLRPPIASSSEVAKDNKFAVPRPNMACAMRPPSSLPHGNKFKEVTTIPVKDQNNQARRFGKYICCFHSNISWTQVDFLNACLSNFGKKIEITLR